MGSKAAVLVSVAAMCALAAGVAPAGAKTCPYPGTVNGISVLIYCGSAKATTTFGAKTATWKSGQCKKVGTNFYVNFGDIVTQPVKKAPDSFQIIAGTSAKPATKDGTYPGTTVMMSKSGKSYLGGNTLTLKLTHATRAGTVTGTIEPTSTNGKLTFHASFTC